MSFFRSLVCLFMLSQLLVACQTAQSVRRIPLPAANENDPLTVLTYNIRVAHGSDNRGASPYQIASGSNLSGVIAAIRSVNPDIVGLQEVAGKEQARAIADALGMDFAYVWHDHISATWWGVALLSKYPIAASRSFRVNDYGTGSREAVVATINIKGVPIDFVNLHRVTDRRSSDGIDAILEATSKLENPVVLIGDFNIGPVDSRLDDLKHVFVDTATATNTYGAELARGRGTFLHSAVRIDYVFAQKGCFQTRDAGLMPEPHWSASDHIGYFAKLDWSSQAGRINCVTETPTGPTAAERLAVQKLKAAEAWRNRQARARCGDAEEQYWLGVMHKAGTAPAKEDALAAYKWVSLAARSGFRLAAGTKQRYGQSLTSRQRDEIHREIEKWKPSACPETKAGSSLSTG